MDSLNKHEVPGSSKGVFYMHNFVSVEEEEYLIRKITDSPKMKWRTLSNRRLQVLGGEVTAKGVLVPQDMPSFVSSYPELLTRLERIGVFKDTKHGRPNHILLNEYLPGQGIMAHEDGPAYHPVVATISLGSHSVLNYYRYLPHDTTGDGRTIDPTPILKLLLEPRSVVVMTGEFYTEHLHGIDGVGEDVFTADIANMGLLGEVTTREVVEEGGRLKRGTRFSLTCRHVARVSVMRGV